MIPDPRQIKDGDGDDGDGPPIRVPGKSGIGDGDDPRLWARAEQLQLVGSRTGPCLLVVALLAVITRGRRVRRSHTGSARFRFRLPMLSAGLFFLESIRVFID